jgi:hypothetical protein
VIHLFKRSRYGARVQAARRSIRTLFLPSSLQGVLCIVQRLHVKAGSCKIDKRTDETQASCMFAILSFKTMRSCNDPQSKCSRHKLLRSRLSRDRVTCVTCVTSPLSPSSCHTCRLCQNMSSMSEHASMFDMSEQGGNVPLATRSSKTATLASVFSRPAYPKTQSSRHV